MAGRDIDVRVPANAQVHVRAAGSFVFVKSSTGPLSVETESGKLVSMTSGDKLRAQNPAGFAGFVMHNETGADITAQLTVGFGDYDKASVVGTVTTSVANTGAATADVTTVNAASVQLLPTNPDRREAIVSNTGTVLTLRLNVDAAAGAALGMPLLPLQTAVLSTQGAIHCYQPPGLVVNVALLEILN